MSCGRKEIDDELLINLIESYPCLYNKTQKEYKDLYQKEKVWDHIASTLSVSKQIVKNRWTALRQRFSREKLAIVEETRSGAKGGHKSRWYLYELMKFLECHVVGRKTVSNNTNNNGEEIFFIQQNNSTNDNASIGFDEHLDADEVSQDFPPMDSQYSLANQSQSYCDELSYSDYEPEIQSRNVPTQGKVVVGSISTNKSSISTMKNSSSIAKSLTPTLTASQNSTPTTKCCTSTRKTSKGDKRSAESLDEDISAVQSCIKEWAAVQHKKISYVTQNEKLTKDTVSDQDNPEASFGKLIADELNKFANFHNRDVIKGEICKLIYQYKNETNNIENETNNIEDVS